MRDGQSKFGYTLKPFVENKCIFIHIPKCAGISVSESLFGNNAGDHMSILRYQLAFSEAEFDSYFKFTFVRNPFDRLVSAFFFLKRGGLNEGDRNWAEANIGRFNSFEDFVHNWVTKENVRTWKHFAPQYQYVFEPHNSKMQVDFLGFFENLEEDYRHIKVRIKDSLDLQALNKSKNRKLDYQGYYTDSMRKIVEQVYYRDIELFGYNFDNSSLPEQLIKRNKGEFYN